MVCGHSQNTVARGCNSEDGVMKRDLYAEVSTRIVAELERGAAPWIKPWSATAGMNTPCNALTNRPYSGCNVLLLWMAANAGYRTPRYLTFKQALGLGGNVRKGEHGTKVYFVKQLQVADRDGEEGETRIVPMMREYTVFRRHIQSSARGYQLEQLGLLRQFCLN
jgi:antirestriction protein ArdC